MANVNFYRCKICCKKCRVKNKCKNIETFFVFYANKLNSNLLKFSVGRKQEEEKDTKIYYVHSNTSGLVSEYMHYFNDFPNKKYSSKCESFGVLNKPVQNLNESKSLHSNLFTIIKCSHLYIFKEWYFDTNFLQTYVWSIDPKRTKFISTTTLQRRNVMLV